MWNYLVPQIKRADLWPMVLFALLGGFIAGIYGIIHNQITFSIGPEYFTKLKFKQFHYADFGWGDRWFASTVGFLASWWVGFIAAWFLGRRLIPQQPREQALRQLVKGIVCIFTVGIVFGVAGYGYGIWCGPEADYSSWAWDFYRLKITDPFAFVRVAYIHNASYLGGLVGLVVALITIRPAGNREFKDADSTPGVKE